MLIVFMMVTRRVDVHYLCGVLNARAVHFWLRHRGKRLGRMLQIDTAFLLAIPIPAPASDPETAAKICALSKLLHATVRQLRSLRSERERAAQKGLMAWQEQQLNLCVDRMYDLDAEQVRVMEVDIDG